MRYPKGIPLPMPEGFRPSFKPYAFLQAEGSTILLVTYGRLFANVLTAAGQLAAAGIPVSVLKLNRIKPIDPECLSLALPYRRVIFFEEGIRTGGIGEWFGDQLVQMDYARTYQVCALDRNPGVCTLSSGLHNAGLDVAGILHRVAPDRFGKNP